MSNILTGICLVSTRQLFTCNAISRESKNKINSTLLLLCSVSALRKSASIVIFSAFIFFFFTVLWSFTFLSKNKRIVMVVICRFTVNYVCSFWYLIHHRHRIRPTIFLIRQTCLIQGSRQFHLLLK